MAHERRATTGAIDLGQEVRGLSVRGWVIGAMVAFLAVPLSSAGEPGQQPSVLAGLRVFEPPGVPPSALLAQRDESYLERFAQGLASGGVVVSERALLQGSILGHLRGTDPVGELRAEARRSGAAYLALASVTLLGEDATLDVQLLPTQPGPAIRRLNAAAEAEQLEEGLERLGAEAAALAAELTSAVSAQAELDPGSEYSAAAAGRPYRGPGPEVVELRIQGNRRIEADAIRAVLGTAEGEPLLPDQIAADVRRIYELGFFQDVQVFSTDVPLGRIVTFVVSESPIIRQVTVTGNDEISSDDIRERLTITVGSTIDYPLLLENRERIRALYQAKGFYLAEVEYSVEPLADDAVLVDFDVVEGEKLRLRSINFEGNQAIDDDKLMEGLHTKPWGTFSLVSQLWDPSGLYAEPIFYQDLDLITRKYMDRGFIRVRVAEPVVDYDEKGIRVTVPIQEGQQFLVGRVDVTGDESTDTGELLGLVGLESGAIFNRSTLTDDVESLRAHYADSGFFDARVRPRTYVDADAHTVDATFEVEKGELYFVDWIRVQGNRKTRDEVVRREVTLAEGDLYSDRALERSRARVQRLGFFEEVSLESARTEENRVGVTVDVVERPTGTFSFGAGFGSTDGFLINGSISQDNLFGRGYSLAASADLGQDNRYGFLRFTDPYFRGTPAALSGRFTLSQVEYIDFDQSVMGFGIDLNYPLDEGETRAGIGYSYSDREVEGFEEFSSASMLQREEFSGSTDTSMVTLTLRRDTRDDIRFPKSGAIYGAALEFAGLGGLNEFLRLEGRVTRYMPARRWLGFDSTFIVNSRAGYVFTMSDVTDLDDLPDCVNDLAGCLTADAGSIDLDQLGSIDTDLELTLSERYFLGGLGAFQVRGFKQRSLGPRRTILQRVDLGSGEVLFAPFDRDFSEPRDSPTRCASLVTGPLAPDACNDLDDKDIDDFENLDLADVIGGSKMFLLNLELQVPISEELGLTGLVFFDMGNAFAEDEAFNPADLRLGTGAGVQWFSPFGPIMLILGFPLDALEDEDGSVFEFSLGGAPY
jgi:outer membrane protein insertion porin family